MLQIPISETNISYIGAISPPKRNYANAESVFSVMSLSLTRVNCVKGKIIGKGGKGKGVWKGRKGKIIGKGGEGKGIGNFCQTGICPIWTLYWCSSIQSNFCYLLLIKIIDFYFLLIYYCLMTSVCGNVT